MRLAVGIALLSLTLLPSQAIAQAAATAPQQDLLAQLLVEVRELRQVMERAATVGARIQMLVARVQLQEQRIAELSRRLLTVRDEISTIDGQAASLLGQVAMFEKTAAGKLPPEQKEQFEQMLESFKGQVAAYEKRRQDLLNEESLLVQQVSADQGRWSDFNSRLDELERSLAAPPPRKP